MVEIFTLIMYNVNSSLISLQQFLEVVIIIAMIGMLGILSNRKKSFNVCYFN